VTDAEPRDEVPAEPLDIEDGDEVESPIPSWRAAIAEMIVALLMVVALVAAFIGVAVVLRRVLA
jgi:hypothetical protein